MSGHACLRHVWPVLFCLPVSLGPIEAFAEEPLKLYSVAAIATQHPNEGARKYFTSLAADFDRLQRAAGTNARFLFSPSRQVNAFATLYSGTPVVVLHQGLIQYFPNDREAIAAVLAHELGHVKQKHISEGVQAQALIQFLANLAGLALDIDQARRGHDSRVGLGGLGAAIGGHLLTKAYSRDQEREADAESVSILIDAGIHPAAAVRVQQRLAASSSGSDPPLLLSTHPPSDERVANLRRQLDASAALIAARFPAGPAGTTAIASNAHQNEETARLRATQLADRLAMEAAADAAFALKQTSAQQAEATLLPGVARQQVGSSSNAIAPDVEGDCKDRGPNRRTCITRTPAGKTMIKTCEKGVSGWQCLETGG